MPISGAMRSLVADGRSGIGRSHVGILCVTALVRQPHGVQDRGLGRRTAFEWSVCQPSPRNVAAAIGKTVLVGDVMDLRAVRDRELRVLLRKDHAEQADRRRPPGGGVSAWSRITSTLRLDEGAIHRGTIGFGDRPREVDAQHLGAGVRTPED